VILKMIGSFVGAPLYLAYLFIGAIKVFWWMVLLIWGGVLAAAFVTWVAQFIREGEDWREPEPTEPEGKGCVVARIGRLGSYLRKVSATKCSYRAKK
jgi:hypothetical protein